MTKNDFGIVACAIAIACASFWLGTISTKQGDTTLEDSNGPIAYNMKWEDCVAIAMQPSNYSKGCYRK